MATTTLHVPPDLEDSGDEILIAWADGKWSVYERTEWPAPPVPVRRPTQIEIERVQAIIDGYGRPVGMGVFPRSLVSLDRVYP